LRTIIDCFDKATKLTLQEGEPAYIRFGTTKDKDPKVNIKSGKVKLESDEVSTLFHPAIQGIVNAIEKQRLHASTYVAAVFLVGGFAASTMLFSKLQAHFKDEDITISRPDSHTNKAVADGAISYYVDHFVSTRLAKLTYGVFCGTPYIPGLVEHEQRIQRKYQSADGHFYINGCFDVLLRKGTSVSETTEFRSSFRRTGSQESLKNLSGTVHCYRGDLEPAPEWDDEDGDNFRNLCTIEADATEALKFTKPRYGRQGVYYRRDFDVILSFGLTELKAQLAWEENGVEKRSPAKIVYDDVDA